MENEKLLPAVNHALQCIMTSQPAILYPLFIRPMMTGDNKVYIKVGTTILAFVNNDSKKIDEYHRDTPVTFRGEEYSVETCKRYRDYLIDILIERGYSKSK